MPDQVDARNIVWTDQVLGREAYKPDSIHLTHIYLEDAPVEPTDPTNKEYVDTLETYVSSLEARIAALEGP